MFHAPDPILPDLTCRTRPRKLLQAARAYLAIGRGTRLPGARASQDRLEWLEAEMDMLRRTGDPAYELQYHVSLLAALIARMRDARPG
ncbi:DUF6477 family protein [Oceanomicrobium pacificus]|uniref:Uncharacterized protein n=1 Tax=Oceanomicrobium pacificus TaxID=2692916 RepID=A0A6B0TQH1_9RHOB|nr:DUF6477 family protein [Oceanomicrobium pacificus]MXU66196.1 hypothetical protein [Oceanomicrobium pacificus]